MSNKKDELAGVIASELNKQFKNQQVAYFLDGQEDTPTDVVGWIVVLVTVVKALSVSLSL